MKFHSEHNRPNVKATRAAGLAWSGTPRAASWNGALIAMLGKIKMRLSRQVLAFCVLMAAGVSFSGGVALAADAPKDLVLKGDAACTSCHDEADSPELLAIGKTRHGTQADRRTASCTGCHGESTAHLKHKGSDKPPKPDVTFGAKSVNEADARSDACQSCHKKDAKRSHWEGSAHQNADVACSSCHKIHRAKDISRDKLAQSEVCFACHKEQRAQAGKPSHHPILEGKMSCSDCHNPHGSAAPAMMKRASTTDTCYSCHMEKRGPFVHNHQPVNEDCSNCHNAHGTVAEGMLKVRAPFLCHTCHTPHAPVQPTVATAPLGMAGWWDGSVIAQGRSCMNCHSQIHGSNNPGRANPNPQRLFR
jgi:DmsE family decaheme c-type cytochrome